MLAASHIGMNSVAILAKGFPHITPHSWSWSASVLRASQAPCGRHGDVLSNRGGRLPWSEQREHDQGVEQITRYAPSPLAQTILIHFNPFYIFISLFPEPVYLRLGVGATVLNNPTGGFRWYPSMAWRQPDEWGSLSARLSLVTWNTLCTQKLNFRFEMETDENSSTPIYIFFCGRPTSVTSMPACGAHPHMEECA